MSNSNYHRVKSVNKGLPPQESGWDLIIRSAVLQLGEIEAVAARLRISIEHFEKRKASGDAFPGEERLRQDGLILQPANK